MNTNKKFLKDGLLIGGLFGAAITIPKISSWFSSTMINIIPYNWLILGEWSIPIYGIILFMLIGLIIDKS